jgi:hypothetical protein
MNKYKIGDEVRVKVLRSTTNDSSTDSKLLLGKIGKVLFVNKTYRYSHKRIEEYVKLDIEGTFIYSSGIWADEIELVEEKKIKEFGIVKFMRETT